MKQIDDHDTPAYNETLAKAGIARITTVPAGGSPPDEDADKASAADAGDGDNL
jgi:hypothetical protein